MLISLRMNDGSALFYDLDREAPPVGISLTIEGERREFLLVCGAETAMPLYREEGHPSGVSASGAPEAQGILDTIADLVGWRGR